MGASMNSFNLLPWRALYYKRHRLSVMMVMLIILLMVIGSGFMVREILNHQFQLSSQVNQKLANEQNDFAKKITTLQQEKQVKQQWFNQFEIIQQEVLQRTLLPEIINLLPTLVLPDIYLKALNLNSDEIILTGVALSPITVTQLIQRMEQTNLFKQIKLLHLKYDLLKAFDFSLQII